MTTKFTVRASIAKQPHDIWHFLTNFDNAPKWMPGIIRVIQSDEGDLGRGSTLKYELKGSAGEVTVSYWDPEKCFTLTSDTNDARIESSCCLEPVDDKTSLVLLVTINLGGLRQFIGPIITWTMKRNANRCLQNIKSMLELTTSTL